MANSTASKYRDFVLLALFAAIVFILAFTPVGFINLVLIKATIIHVPVIIGSILLGPKKGAVLGFCFGLASLLSNTLTPSLLSFAFTPAVNVPGTSSGSVWSLLICFVPRLLVGIVPYYLYILFQKLFRQNEKGEFVSLGIAALGGAMTNTILVMNLIYFLFKDAYASVKGIAPDAVYGAVLAVIGTNGVPEAIFAIVLTVIIGKVLLRIRRKQFGN